MLRSVAAVAALVTVTLGWGGQAVAAPAGPHRVSVSSASLVRGGGDLVREVRVARPMDANQVVFSRWVDWATIDVWYHDGWNWVTVSGAGGRAAEAGIWSPYSGWGWSYSYGSAPNWFGTTPVWAPGNTCVTAYLDLQETWWPYQGQVYYWRVC